MNNSPTRRDSLPREATDLLRSHRNVVVTAPHGSPFQQDALEEIIRTTWVLGGHTLVLCSAAFLDRASAVFNGIAARCYEGVEAEVVVQPKHASQLWNDFRPTILLMTAQHLFEGYFFKYNPEPYPRGYCLYGVLLPSSQTLVSIGLDACDTRLEAAQFEICWQILQPLVDFRQAVFVEGATNLDDLVTPSKAHLVPLASAQSMWMFQSALTDLDTCSQVLKAVIANKEYVPEAHFRDVLRMYRFPFPHLTELPIHEALQALIDRGEVFRFEDRGTLYYTVFPDVLRKFRLGI